MEQEDHMSLNVTSMTVKDLTVLGDHEILVLVYSNGRVFWPPGTFDKTICHCDVTYFPFDTQTCDILLTTWTYGKDDILLLFDSKPIEMGFFLPNGEWEYRKYSTAILDSFWNGVAVRQLKYSFTFRRRPLFHVLISLIPLMLLSFISVITFRLPVESGERIGFCLTNLLAFALYLTLVASYIPTTSYTTSFLCT
ncbi:hypothetical protein KUTeg_005189 [Tegillarca granosa]|uniref:Neurotransmitter-gated ion-channel ligand-binding domain-containing protein n=1 Tax=Tegillarca granosa TaxID=220873 RepID=A0ABQ9FJ18_TEGGR|nr:hypothetical protein KUTeg_005189 [Tegillarca granosa]